MSLGKSRGRVLKREAAKEGSGGRRNGVSPVDAPRNHPGSMVFQPERYGHSTPINILTDRDQDEKHRFTANHRNHRLMALQKDSTVLQEWCSENPIKIQWLKTHLLFNEHDAD